MKTVHIRINGDWRELTVAPGERLIDTLRDRLDLTGTKEGCGQGECGACTVQLNEKAVSACLVLTAQADGADILTIEGVQDGLCLHPLQQAFLDENAVQCGFCTPGMIMAGHALLRHCPDPDENRVRQTLSGNLCRCTGYEKPVAAVLRAARKIREDRS